MITLFRKKQFMADTIQGPVMEEKWLATAEGLRRMKTRGYVDPKPSTNLTKISDSIGKVKNIIATLRANDYPNFEAIDSWGRVLRELNLRWADGMLDCVPGGRYNLQ